MSLYKEGMEDIEIDKILKTEINELKDLEYQLFLQERKILNEESTKQCLVLPMFCLWGFDIYNMNEVMPEYPITEIGRADYVLKDNGNIHFIIEVKKLDSNLISHINQLKEYVDNINESKVGILTDGNKYLFFNKDSSNKMKDKPFLVFTLINNFRSDRVSTWVELIKTTRLSNKYIEDNLLNFNWLNEYTSILEKLKLMDKNKKEVLGIDNLIGIYL